MQGIERPRGRRMTVRVIGAATIAAALFGGGAAAAAAAAAEETALAPAIETYPAETGDGGPLAAGADGAMWSFERRDGGLGAAIVRYGPTGLLSRADAPVPWERAWTPPTPQADGGMAVVVSPWNERGQAPMRLHAGARGTRVTAIRLPRSARTADAFAVAGDGTVWWADTCARALRRWRPGKPLLNVPMRIDRCRGGFRSASALAVGPDGAVWYVNANQGWVVRRDVRGGLRRWAFWPAREWAPPSSLAVDPRGASLAFGDLWGHASGLVTRAGRNVRTALGLPAFAPGGTLWSAGADALVSRRSDGKRTASPLPPDRDAIAIAIARDGRPWVMTGVFADGLSAGTYYDDVAIATTGGAPAGWPIAAAGRRAETSDDPLPLTLGGDGALWTRVWTWGGNAVARIVPPGLRAPRRPVARVTGVLARNGRTVVLQVRCAAERGRFCRGAVTLGGGAKAVRYVAPGQNGAAVSLTLTRRAARTLRRRGALTVGARAGSAGAGTTRTTVRLRR